MSVCPPAESCCEYPHTNNENYEADKHGYSEILYFISHYQETEDNQKNAQNDSWQSYHHESFVCNSLKLLCMHAEYHIECASQPFFHGVHKKRST